MINIIKHAIDTHGINKAHYAVIDFAESAITRLRFSDLYTDPANLKRVVSAIRHRKGQPNLLKALEEAERLFKDEAEVRGEARQILVVIVDRNTVGNEEFVKKTAKQLEEMRVKIIVIAIGDEVDPSTLDNITPKKDHVIKTPKEGDPHLTWSDVMGLILFGKS